MSFKRNLIIAIIFLVIGAVYFGVQKMKTKKEQKKEAEAMLLSESKDKISAFELENENGKFRLEKKNDTWYIVSPVYEIADKDTIEVILSNLSGAKKSDVFEADSLEPYGLAKPKTKITLEFTEPQKKTAVLIGDESTYVGKYFSKLADGKEVFTLPSYINNNLQKKLFDFREKIVLSCEPDMCTSFTLVNSNGIAAGARDVEGEWRLSKPLVYPGDKDEITNLFRKVNFARIVEYVEPTTTTLASYGLEMPEITFTVTTKSKDNKTTTSTLLIGTKKETNYYAKRADNPRIFLLKNDVYDELKKHPYKFRNTRLFSINMIDVDKIEIVKETEKIELVKNAEQKWEFADDKNTRCDHDKVSSLLSQVISGKADKFVADYPQSWAEYGLDVPKVKFVITDAEKNKSETIYLGKRDEEGKTCYARKSGEDTVINIPSTIYDAINKTKDDFIDKRLFPDIVRGDIKRVEFADGDTSYVLQLKDLNWELGRVTAGEEKIKFHPVETAKVNLLLDNILELKYKSSLTEAEAKPQLTNLDKPAQTFYLFNKDKKLIAELKLGTATPNETFVTTGKNKFFTIPQADTKDILNALTSLKESLK
ncbi:MAG: DUF4340 domain-containing protein [Candidatus Sumerlaeia bacterium]|nr:DUF4340 domain-containing protein [Candidatus Sumerlaeia bacterium]